LRKTGRSKSRAASRAMANSRAASTRRGSRCDGVFSRRKRARLHPALLAHGVARVGPPAVRRTRRRPRPSVKLASQGALVNGAPRFPAAGVGQRVGSREASRRRARRRPRATRQAHRGCRATWPRPRPGTQRRAQQRPGA
jgi:hypothetical protein